MKRKVYLSMKSIEEARRIIEDRFCDIRFDDSEEIDVAKSRGRVLAEPVFAKISSPNFHASAMDGIAVKASTTYGASEKSPKTLVVNEDAFFINTGHMLPEGTDAVIMIENVLKLDEKRLVIEKPAFPWQYVRKMGEDIVATQLLFTRNHKITPYCIGAMLTAGVFSVKVKKKPKVLIIPTGDELVSHRDVPPEKLAPGRIYETNSFMLGNMVEENGCVYIHHERLPDDFDLIAGAVKKAVGRDYQAILILGGSSAGSMDYSGPVIESLGRILVHGVTMMPGKPVVIGEIEGKPVFGMPGYPVSAIMAFDMFVRPLLLSMAGFKERGVESISVVPARKIASKLGVDEFVRVKLGRVRDRVVAIQLPRGAGSITSITEADGIIRIPSDSEGIQEGATVCATLIRPASEIEKTIVAVGSHDNSMDVLADELRARTGGIILSSSHVGSMGGLIALKKGLCHMAGSHLLDTETGEYNIPYIKRFLPGTAVVLVHLVTREQGLIVKKGNPKQIESFKDLTRDDVAFVNRQGGSGTRILLDYNLRQLNIDCGQISGYENEEFTHMAVAVAVLGGVADAGLGIYAAAKALDLDFIPVTNESYDLIIPETCYEQENIKQLLDVISSSGFKRRVHRLGGYSTELTGEIVRIEG